LAFLTAALDPFYLLPLLVSAIDHQPDKTPLMLALMKLEAKDHKNPKGDPVLRTPDRWAMTRIPAPPSHEFRELNPLSWVVSVCKPFLSESNNALLSFGLKIHLWPSELCTPRFSLGSLPYDRSERRLAPPVRGVIPPLTSNRT